MLIKNQIEVKRIGRRLYSDPGSFPARGPQNFRRLCLLGFIVVTALTPGLARERHLMDAGWRFQLGDPPDVTTNVTYYPEIPDLAKLQTSEVTGANSETNLMTLRADPVATGAGEDVSFVLTNYNDSAWRALDQPHDWVVELPFSSSGSESHGCKAKSGTNNIGWYRRTFTLPAEDAGKVMWLDFDGIYRNALIWLNGRCVGRNVSGYAPNSFEITPFVRPGDTNVLVVRVDATRDEGWFYEGAGIYRHVWLVKTSPLHVAHWGTYVRTATAGPNATVTVQTTITNQDTLAVAGSLTSTVLDANSNAVAAVTSAINLAAGQGVTVTQTLAVADARLWSLSTPYLYNLVSTVSNQNAVADAYETPFGIRTVSFDPNQGLSLNGERVEVQGMCNHQDHAGVGSALPDRLQYFRIERLKQMGVNAYRTSHNPPSSELLDACDQLGMLVLEENRRIGTDPESLGQLQRLMLRDRNHPSIFLWSLGNEEPTQASSTGAQVMQTMQNLAHQLDPTRQCTVAMNGSWGSGFSTVIDVQGFNYNNGGLDGFHASYPAQNCIGTEVAGTVTTRGIYTNDTANGYVASYDIQNSEVDWGSTAEQWWSVYSARPWIAGGFVWTGFDYRGEPTPYSWPCINSHFGIMDVCGFPKDLFYYYQANWTAKNVLHLFPHWNWAGREGQPINVWAFGNCEAVELFLNGSSQGRKPLNAQGHVEWDVPYASGTLQAVGYRRGLPVATNTITTTGAPAAVALWPDRKVILADGRDVSVVTVAVLDAQGCVVPTATNLVNFTVDGAAIIGVGNGDPSSHEADKVSQRSVFNGLAEVIVQSTNQPDVMTLTAASAGLTATNVTISAAAILPAPPAPAGLSAVAGDAQVTVSWDIVPGATSYNLARATASGGPYVTIATHLASLEYLDGNVTNATTYYYVVSANGNGTGSYSEEVDATPMTVVSNLTAGAINSQVQLQWNAPAGAAAYNVKRATTTEGPYTIIAAGLAATNFTDTNVFACATYYYVVTITNSGSESPNSPEAAAISPGALPPQFTSADIGSVGLPGSASFCGGQFTVSGSGADIWGTADAFQFVYVYVPACTNCDIRARVLGVADTQSNAKTAVMIRESLAANSRHASADVEASEGIEFLWRTNTGSTSISGVASGLTAPYWVRLTRTNDTFQAYCSPDGNAWAQIGSAVTISMSNNVYAGLAVCSHNNSALNTSVLDNVSASFLTNGPPVISWVVPTNNSAFIQPKTITLTAWARDPDGVVTNVAFFGGETLLGTVTNGAGSLYNLIWSNAAPASYTLSARAMDNSGFTNIFPAAIAITVKPLTLLASGFQSNGQFTLSCEGQTGQSYILETSTNLAVWVPLQTNAPVNGLVEFIDSGATDTARFYRVKQ
ncbi:MAG: beta-galactosidase GalA [Verrucomicrobiota bacterium]